MRDSLRRIVHEAVYGSMFNHFQRPLVKFIQADSIEYFAFPAKENHASLWLTVKTEWPMGKKTIYEPFRQCLRWKSVGTVTVMLMSIIKVMLAMRRVPSIQ